MGTDNGKDMCCCLTHGHIQILLSTYNGEKYLREQLDSYVNQTAYSHIKVLIRDDGSTDQTVSILKEYEKIYNFRVIYGENIGINSSYRILLEASDPDCQYFALSDQDDVWLPDKLEIALSRLSKEDQSCPLLFSSLSSITDEKLNRFSTSVEPRYGVSFYNAMVQNVCPGHTQVFNRKMMEYLLRGNSTDIHVLDWWVYLVASGLGKVIFEPRCTVLHRQHGNNAIGYERNSIKLVISRVKRVRSQEAVSITKQIIAFFDIFGESVQKDYLNELMGFLNSQSTVVSRGKYLCRSKIYRQTKVETILLRLLYLIGKYKLRDE